MSMKLNKNYFFRFALFFVFFQSSAISAQQVEEVVVEAEQSENAVLDDMASVSAIDGEKLADAGIENVEDVAAYVPNLVLSETDTGTNIVIRGIGAGVNQGFDQSVGLYIDGVPLPRGQMARAPFLDLAGVQVLRGPQYVRDGNYSIAGSVHMITSASSDQFELGMDFNYVPTQNDRTLLLTGSLPISDWGGLRVAIQKSSSDGYIENVARAEDGPQSDDLLFRGVLTVQPTENLSFKLKVEQGSFDSAGRQIEILESQPTPDYREFDSIINGIDPRFDDGRLLGLRGPRRLAQPESIATPYRTETDILLSAHRTLYDVRLDGIEHNGMPANSSGNGTGLLPAYAGTTYLEYLHNLYTGNSEIKTIDFGDGPITVSPGYIEPPPGLLDASVDFKRAADGDEFGKNDSINITLNTEWLVGEHTLDLTASYIDYDFVERIDADFTPVPLLLTDQSESYTQDFYSLTYTSPKDSFVEFYAGASFLSSELEFLEEVDIQVPKLQTSLEANNFISNRELTPPGFDREADISGNVVFNPEFPAMALFGRVSALFNNGLRLYTPNRIFEQDAETKAAFFEAKVNWSDSLRTIFGARYTHSEKSAVRDFAYLLASGETFAFDPTIQTSDPTEIQRIQFRENTFRNQLSALFNFGEHSDRAATGDLEVDTLDADRGSRREEAFLPSLNVEWDATPDLSFRAAVRLANKLGGFDARSNSSPRRTNGFLQPGTFEFEDEDATTYEIGGRWYLPNGYGEFIATAFYTDFRNLQVSAQDRSVGFNVQNAGAAKTLGVEIEGLLALTEKFNINYSMAWIEFEFTDYPLATCPLTRLPELFQVSTDQLQFGFTEAEVSVGDIFTLRYDELADSEEIIASTSIPKGFGSGATTKLVDGTPLLDQDFLRFDYNNFQFPRFCDFEGQTNQYVAEWQGTFTFNYQTDPTPIGVIGSTLDVLYNSGYETTVTQDSDVAQDEYVQLNGRLSLQSQDETWELALTAENITNEKIVLFANEVPLSTRLIASKSHYGFVRSPRAVGVNFRYSFY